MMSYCRMHIKGDGTYDRILPSLLLLLASAPSARGSELTYIDLASRLTDWSSVRSAAGRRRCAQWSSYDRASVYDQKTGKYVNGTNETRGYIPGGDQFVCRDGPRVHLAICLPRPRTATEIYSTARPSPRSICVQGLLQRERAPFIYSAWFITLLRCNSYVPILTRNPARSRDKGWGNYYHFTYATFPKDTRATFTPTRTARTLRGRR